MTSRDIGIKLGTLALSTSNTVQRTVGKTERCAKAFWSGFKAAYNAKPKRRRK